MSEEPKPGRDRRLGDWPAIPGYRIEGVLGRGGSGVVYRARQLSVDRPVALKVLHPSSTTRESTVKRLRREARLMAMLEHPNIVSAVDVGTSPDGWWMAMELVEGQALSDRLRRGGPMTEKEAMSLFIPLCDALQHAHEAGVIHRDVKPANILLTQTGAPRLVDLGLARSDDEPQLTRVGATMGTPHYVSPEQARNPASVDARSDVYSLAATLHHVVCGAPPFPGESPAEVISSVLHDPLENPRERSPEVSRGMSLVLRKALSKDPNRRHTSAREMAVDLRLIAEGRKPRVQLRHLEPVKGSLGKRWHIVAGAVGLVGCGVFFAIQGLNETEPVREVVESQTRFEGLEEQWRHDELLLAEAMAMHASMVPDPSERTRYERLGFELERALESLLFELRSKADAGRPALLHERRFGEARSVLKGDFAAALRRASGFTPADLPDSRREAILRWHAMGEAQIDAALESTHRDGAGDLSRWCEQVLWPEVSELVNKGEFDEAAEALEPELIDHLEEAGVRTDGLDLDRLVKTEELVALAQEHARERYDLERAWRELDEVLLAAVREACGGAEERLKIRAVPTVSDDLHAWASAHFRAAGLELAAMPTRFRSRAADEFVLRVNGMEKLERRLSEELTRETMGLLDEESQALLGERRYAQLVDWWIEKERNATPGVAEVIDSRIAEARLLAELLEDARARVVAGVERVIVLKEGGFTVKSTVRLEGDPVYERFWVTIAPGSERAWRLGGPPQAAGGVRRVSEVTLEGLSGRDEACLEVAFLRLAEGDVAGAHKCYRALEAGEAATRLGDEMAARLGPLLAAESLSESERREWAVHWVDSRDLERLLEGHPSKAMRNVETFLRDYEDVLDDERLARVRSWRDALERESTPSTVQEFEEEFGADTTRFPRRGRVELTQRFDAVAEGAWEVGEWIPRGVGWQAPRLAGVEEVLTAKAPTLLLRDPFDLTTGLVEVELEVQVPEDSRARLVVMSGLGFHCTFMTGEGATGRVVAGSRDLEGVVQRAVEGEGEEFSGLRPGEPHRLRMQANQARGTLTVFFDGEECVRIEDLSPKDRARSTSVSLRSLEPLLLLGSRIEAGRR